MMPSIGPHTLRTLNLIVFLALIPWTIALTIPASPMYPLAESVAYVTFISHVALILSSLSAWQSARVETRQEEDESKQTLEEIKQTQAEQAQTENGTHHVRRVEKKVDGLHEKLDTGD